MRTHAQKPVTTTQTSMGNTPLPGHIRFLPRAETNSTPIPAGQQLFRDPAGPGPAVAPSIVHGVLRSPGQSLPAHVQQQMERGLGHNFGDVRVHTDQRASASAQEVSAHAYTVGRQIVFSAGRFEPATPQGRELLAHELTHAAEHPYGAPTPSGDLRISSPAEPAEQHAVNVSKGRAGTASIASAQPTLFRTPDPVQAPPTPTPAPAPVPLANISVNHDRVTVPPVAGLAFAASPMPTTATGVNFSLVGDNATIASGTSISSTGAITVAAGQAGGSAHVQAVQTITAPDGSSTTSTMTAPFNFNAIPSGISSTSASPGSSTSLYGGNFTHTFSSPGGGQTALERSRVNEMFPAASGRTLALTGPIGSLSITVNDPDAATSGWDLDSSGDMLAADHVTWANTFSARPFVANASNPTPTNTLPQALTATQNFRNLTYPDRTYGATVVASTTHRRAFEERNNQIKAVTSANATGINEEVEEDYVGPTIFRRAAASPTSIPVVAPTPRGGSAPTPTTSTITVDAEGQAATPTFTIQSPNLGCTITRAGVLTPGTTAGIVTVRAGNRTNYDEVTVTLTPLPAPAPAPSPTPDAGTPESAPPNEAPDAAP